MAKAKPKTAKPKTKAKSKARVKKPKKAFGISLPDTFFGAVEAYFRSPFLVTLAGILTTGVLAASLLSVQAILGDTGGYRQTLVYMLGMTVVGIFALPWYFYALALADGRRIVWSQPFLKPKLFYAQAVASLWFWAGFMLGGRYIAGIPAILALVFYAFHGFLIADGAAERGLAALGTSVRLGEGRRLGLAVVAGLLGIFFFIGASAMGVEGWSNPAKITGAILGTAVTGSITMIAGAKIYLVLERDLK